MITCGGHRRIIFEGTAKRRGGAGKNQHVSKPAAGDHCLLASRDSDRQREVAYRTMKCSDSLFLITKPFSIVGGGKNMYLV